MKVANNFEEGLALCVLRTLALVLTEDLLAEAGGKVGRTSLEEVVEGRVAPNQVVMDLSALHSGDLSKKCDTLVETPEYVVLEFVKLV